MTPDRVAIPRRRPAAVLLSILAVSSALVSPTVTFAADPVLPFGFRDEVVISGLNLPTDVEFAPNGQVFVAEKAGRIKLFDSVSDTSATLVADLRTKVYNNGDKGLLGIAVDPAYPSTRAVYALYSFDAKIGGTAPTYGQPNTDGDPCFGPPNGPGGDGCYGSSRVSRLALDANGVMTAGGESVLVNDWCIQFDSHSIGTVTFGPDGYLYAGGGDGASYGIADLDHGQFGGTAINPNTGQPYTPRNPCGDPPGGVGGPMTAPTAEGGALRAQSVRRPSNEPTVLNGTIIRVDPTTGAAPASNPAFTNGRDANERRIVAYGLRNPYRFTVRPGTNEIWVGDVGSFKSEEVNRIPDPTNKVRNFGWPCYEGNGRNGGWDSKNMNLCESLYAAGSTAVEDPYYQYLHGDPLGANDPCSTSGGVISGMAFEQGGFYPAKYHDALFVTDYARRCIWAIRAGANGLPDASRLEVIEQNAAGPVDLEMGPDGQLYYVDIEMGAIHRVSYDGDNQPPVIVATATPQTGQAPLAVDFDAGDSHDIEGDPLTIDWDLDGNGTYEILDDPTTSRTYSTGTWAPKVRVRDDHSNTSTQTFQIKAGNIPMPVIDTPSASTKWHVGEALSFSGHATDAEDGNVPAAQLSWRWIMHHCTGPAPEDCHEHIEMDLVGNPPAPFTAPEHEYPSFLELQLTATDSDGLTATVSRNFQPEPVDVTFATNPSGLELNAAGETNPAPFTRTFIVNSSIALNAPQTQWFDGVYYDFDAWSDGGARGHSIKAPAQDATYTAQYVPISQADAPNTCATAAGEAAQDTWLDNTLSGRRDVDWYSFGVDADGWSRILLGNIGGNYRLDLYGDCGQLIASSTRGGKQFEEILRQLDAGTYHVRIKRQEGAVAKTVPYGLRFMQLSDGLPVLSSSGWTSGSGQLHIAGDVLNNTNQRRRLIEVTATLYDASDAVLGTNKGWAWVNVVAPHARTQFHLVMAKPNRYHHYSVEVTFTQQTPEEIVSGFAITSSTKGSDAGGIWFGGSFTNTNSFNVNWASAVVALYDKWGALMNLDSRSTSPTHLATNQSATYQVPFSEHFVGWNRATRLIQGSRP